MKNTLKIDFAEGLIIMDRTFAKNATNTNTPEYAHLQQVRRDYPEFRVVQHTITRNVMKKTYAGLTYDYMKYYIRTHEEGANIQKALDELDELILISECHGKAYRYPVIKKWFLEKYPKIAEYGMELQNERTGLKDSPKSEENGQGVEKEKIENVKGAITETTPLAQVG